MTEEETYEARLGCINCNKVYIIDIPKGIDTPNYLFHEQPTCENCGCATLRVFNEYTAEKKIIKDLLLHRHFEMLDGDDGSMKHDHFK